VALDIFTQKLGDLTRPFDFRSNPETMGIVADKMLDAVQTVVDVMSDPKTGRPYRVSFAPGASAFTDRGERIIVISGKPLMEAQTGTPLADVAAVMTGFALHEVGHANRDGKLFKAVEDRWPGKDVPKRLANILEDVALELATVDRYAGFKQVFDPTMGWVAKNTCPTFPIPWGTKTGDRVNLAGQVVRYRPFVRFADDPQTAKAVKFFDDWRDAITGDITVPAALRMIADALAFIHDHSDDPEPEPPVQPPTPPEGPTTDGGDEPEPGDGDPGEGKGGGGTTTEQTIPDDEDEDDTEGDGDGSDGDGNDGDDDGGTEGGGDSDDDEDGQPTEGGDDDDGEGKGNGDGEGRSGDGNDADTLDRTDAPKGANDGDGKGGSGQAVSETDPDEGFDPADVDSSFDEVAKPDDGFYSDQNRIASAEAEERVTTRMDAGAHGTMRVIFR